MIVLESVLPKPLGHLTPEATDVWLQKRHFEKGQYYLMKAPSGKGKSTFIHLLYGIRQDYTGRYLWDGKAVEGFSLKEWTRIRQRRLAIVFQGLRLFPQLSGWENIMLKQRLTRHVPKSRIIEMAELLGIHDKLKQSCKTLSLGQQQRVAIIRALVQPFDFLLMDEPFSHLDTANIQLASQLIDSVCKQEGAGLILTSLGNEGVLTFDAHLRC